jgi:hypothetical protein
MIYRTMIFKSQPSLVYVIEHPSPFGVVDELMIFSLLRSAGMVDMMVFSEDPRQHLGEIKKQWPKAESLFWFDRQSVLIYECHKCGQTYPRAGGSAHDKTACPCGTWMTGAARIHGLPWEN